MLLGESMNTDSLCFIVTGDLAFFYDMNALGIRHIKNNVRVMGKVLGKRPDIQGSKDANDMAEKYIRWLDDISKGFDHTFSGPEKWNLDQAESFSSGNVEKVGSYADEGQYTILISETGNEILSY